MKDYIQNALRTESRQFQLKKQERLLHAGMGLVTESAEFLDALKKSFFYGEDLDKVNLEEELGDIFWYMAVACDALGTDFETVMKRNIEKLQARYPERFTTHHAGNRDLKKEREILER